MLTIHLPVKFKPSSIYWLSNFNRPDTVQIHFNELVADMNDQAYLKIIKQIQKIGDHFKFSKTETKKLVSYVDKESVAGYVVDNGTDDMEDDEQPVTGECVIFNEFYRLVVDTPIKNCIITKNHYYFKEFAVKCLITFNEHYQVKYITFYLHQQTGNKENRLEIVLDKNFNMISIKMIKLKYNKKSTGIQEHIKEGDELDTLASELDKAVAFYN
jgi:hypothetical protein